MPGATSALYEPLIERDLEAIPLAVKRFREEHSSDELFLAVARFAVLAYAPAQHAKHAMLACLSAWELREELGPRFDDVLIECARYAASSRQPWSEPPILEPPPPSTGSIDELRAAVEGGDRLRAERWLSARLDDDPAPGLFEVASDDFEDLGHKLIVANAAVKLAAILGEKGRFAALRVATAELTAYRGEPPPERREPDLGALLAACDGSIETTHAVFLYCAARDGGVLQRLPADLAVAAPKKSENAGAATKLEIPVYRLARDYGATLKAHSLRLGDDAFLAAVHHNLEHGESFEEFAFA